MYGWAWRRLPGNVAVKLTSSLVIAVAVVVLLFLVVFPMISTHLPFSHVTVTN